MAWIDYYLKIENLEQLDNIYEKIDLVMGEAKWKSNLPSYIAPITRFQYIMQQKIDKDKDKLCATYLKRNNFTQFLTKEWDDDFMTVGDIMCSDGLIKEYPHLLDERISLYGKKANNTIVNNDKWIAVFGGGNMPLKLIEKTCREEKITAIFNIVDDLNEKRQVIKITEDKTQIYKFSTSQIFANGLDPVFYELGMYTEPMLKQLITASILYEQDIDGFTHIKNDELINMYKIIKEQIDNNDKSLVNELMREIENDAPTIFEINQEQLRQLCNSYSLKEKIKGQLKSKPIINSYKKI